WLRGSAPSCRHLRPKLPRRPGDTKAMGMLDAIAASLGSGGGDAVTRAGGAAVPGGQARAARPILQLNRFPVTLDTGRYQNARSGRNPSGDLRSLFALHQIVAPGSAL